MAASPWAQPADLLLRRVERMRAQQERTGTIRRFVDSARARRRYGDHACDRILDLIRKGHT